MRRDTRRAGARHIDGVEYFSQADVTERLGVNRQTLWRWRRAMKVPTGLRLNDRRILFSARDIAAIEHFRDHLEPAVLGEDDRQGRLFARERRGGA